ncbi:MAG: FlgD immunoglobulin-like domain containing protein [Candidatus Zixiibacteriota bacterium]
MDDFIPHLLAAIRSKNSSRLSERMYGITFRKFPGGLIMYKSAIVIFLSLFLSATPAANARPYDRPILSDSAVVAKASNASQPSVTWPRMMGVHADGHVGMSVNCHGQLGNGFSPGTVDDPESDLLPPSFVVPPDSNNHFLFGGGLWIGGIVNGDSIVSAGANGWNYESDELRPDAAGSGTVRLRAGVADKQFIATYADTVGEAFYLDPRLEGVAVSERTFSWVTPPYDDFIIYDLTIRNIGENAILDTWIGYYVDCDVYSILTFPNFGHSDDIVGIRRVAGVPYIMDNDGDPLTDDYFTWNEESIRGAFGFKLLDTYPPATDTSFNWWMRTLDGGFDWGPRYIGDTSILPFYEFESGGDGQPTTDRDRYHMLSNSEIDYDFLWMTFMRPDPNWLPAPASSIQLSHGYDARFLYSFGEYDLMPGDSVRFVFALVYGEDVHVDPDDFSEYFDNELPEKLYYQFDFSDLDNNAAAAKALYESGYVAAPPAGPVQGTEIVDVAGEGIHIRWLPREHPDMMGYNVYITPIPEDQAFFADTVLGYRDTTSMTLHNVDSVISGTEYLIGGLTEGRMYFYSVASAFAHGTGRKSKPGYFTYGFPDPPLTDTTTKYIKAGGLFSINWLGTEDDIDHYNVYKRVGYEEFMDSYGPTTWDSPEYKGESYDSIAYYIQDTDTTILYFFKMEPYASVPADNAVFTDTAIFQDLYYFVTAVDISGRESELSKPIHVFVRGPVNKDILIYLPNSGRAANAQSIDSLTAFYDRVFAGQDITYDYFFIVDSINVGGCDNFACMGWSVMAPYNIVIFDDNLRDATLYYEVFGSFTTTIKNYIYSGGNFAYFGNLLKSLSGIFVDTLTLHYEPGDFEYDILHLDSLNTLGLLLYTNGLISTEDTIGGLIRAEPAMDQYPALNADTSFYWWNASFYEAFFWPISTPPMTGCLYPHAPAETIYYYRSHYPQSSWYEGLTCGARYSVDSAHVYTFIMHPWFFDEDDFRSLINCIIDESPVSVSEDNEVLPDDYALFQNYPNPFNVTTNIKFHLPRATETEICIYNILGRKIRTLLCGRAEAGYNSVTWDGNDAQGKPAASGIYLYRIKADDFIQSEKMLLLK